MRTFLLTILFVPFLAIAQTSNLDTIALAECKANYPIIGTTADLQFVPDVAKWHYCYNVKNQRYPTSRLTDTIFYYSANQIYGDDYEISYLENEGKIRLEYILLKKHKKFKMNVGGFGWTDKSLKKEFGSIVFSLWWRNKRASLDGKKSQNNVAFHTRVLYRRTMLHSDFINLQ